MNERRPLTGEEGARLVRVAHASIAHWVKVGEKWPLDGESLPAVLRVPGAAFVTVRNRDGSLRGCIGSLAIREPLVENVRNNAVQAVSRDPRFAPLCAAEAVGLLVEVSVLEPGPEPASPFIRVADTSEIHVGRDGLYLMGAGEHGGGLLLPQVASDRGFDTEAFLLALCKKAGAPAGAWQLPGVALYRFRVQAFSGAAA